MIEVTDYRPEERRVEFKVGGGPKETAVINASKYEEVARLENVLIILPMERRLRFCPVHKFVNKETNDLVAVSERWNCGDKIIAYNIYAPKGKSVKDMRFCPLGHAVAADVVFNKKTSPGKPDYLIVDVYISGDVKPNYVFKIGDEGEKNVIKNIAIPGTKKFFRIYKYVPGVSSPSKLLLSFEWKRD